MLKILENSIITIDKILSKKLSVKLRIKLLKNKEKIASAIKNIMIANNQIIMTYVDDPEPGKEIKFKSTADKIECEKQLNELNLDSFDVNITIFKLEELEEYITELSDEELESILFMLED